MLRKWTYEESESSDRPTSWRQTCWLWESRGVWCTTAGRAECRCGMGVGNGKAINCAPHGVGVAIMG